MKAFLTFIVFITFQTTCFSLELPKDIPSEIAPFAEKGTIIITWKSADLNGDGLSDYLVVLEQQKKNSADPDIKTKQRPVLIIVRQLDNSLKLVKRNDIVASCSTCSGNRDEGLAEVTATNRSFSISNQTLSKYYLNTDTYVFGYSKRDNTWQLVRVESNQEIFAGNGSNIKNIDTPPHGFGKIDFSEFDPEFYIQQGEGYKPRKRK